MKCNSIRYRLFASMLLTTLIPLLICTVLMVRITRLQMDDRTREDAVQQSETLLTSLDTISTALSTSAQKLTASGNLLHSLSDGQGCRLQINEILLSATDDFRSCAVFDLYDAEGGCCYSTQGSIYRDLPTQWGVLHGAAAQPGTPVYYATENPSDTASPLLTGAIQLRAEDGCCGYLVMRMYLSDFHRLVGDMYAQSNILILNRFFRPIYSSESYLNQSLAPQLRQRLLDGERLADDDCLYTLRSHAPTGMFLVVRQPRLYTERTVQLLSTAGLICAIISVVFSVGVGLLISRQFSSPILRLQQAFDQVQRGDLDTQVDTSGTDELARLADGFNRMVYALKSNREELLHNQQELNEAQIRMLQAQLNPHFLCNTLDTMKWISKINKVPQVALMSTNLADILRFCISAEEFVPLYREIETLERYIEIQRIRLSDDFAFRLDIPEELYDCMIPKMILQPIVENAILHGLSDAAGSVICVSAREDGRLLRITVTDNGRGFPPEMLGRPYRRNKALAKGHLGLYNVDTILRRNYEEDCGLFLGCGEGGIGASVTAVLPIRFEGESEC